MCCRRIKAMQEWESLLNERIGLPLSRSHAEVSSEQDIGRKDTCASAEASLSLEESSGKTNK